MIRAHFKVLRSMRRTVGIFGTIGVMKSSSREQKAIKVRVMYRMSCPASTSWMCTANGSIPQIMAGFGVRAALLPIGLHTVTGIGGGVQHMAGPGSQMSRGVGSHIIMGDGHFMANVGAGCPA